jgi:hypothetical protein
MSASRVNVAMAAAAAMALAALPAQALTVVNGNFETGDFTGWTLSGAWTRSAVFDEGDGIWVYEGTYSAALGNEYGGATLSQSFQVVPGAPYTLSYALSNLLGRPQTAFNVTLGDSGFSLPNGFMAFPYGQFKLSTVATGHTLDLRFNFDHDGYWLLDDIQIAGPAVPEPATWALLLAGLGAVAGQARRRRSAH